VGQYIAKLDSHCSSMNSWSFDDTDAAAQQVEKDLAKLAEANAASTARH
jgi:hypothetical protein